MQFPSNVRWLFLPLLQKKGDRLDCTWTCAHWVEWRWNWRVEYWAIRSSVRSFAHTAHSFACSALLASFARSAALIHSLAPLTRSLRSSWERDLCLWVKCVEFISFLPTVLLFEASVNSLSTVSASARRCNWMWIESQVASYNSLSRLLPPGILAQSFIEKSSSSSSSQSS